MTHEEIEKDRSEGTSGPWRVGPVDDTVVIAPDGSEVAAIDGDYNEPDLWPVMEANARRIARLPELEQGREGGRVMRWYWPAWSCFCIVMQALYLADGRYGLATVFFGLCLFCQAVDQILDAIRAPR